MKEAFRGTCVSSQSLASHYRALGSSRRFTLPTRHCLCEMVCGTGQYPLLCGSTKEPPGIAYPFGATHIAEAVDLSRLVTQGLRYTVTAAG